MRITNKMMSSNVLYNIQNSLYKMDKYSNQLSTGKKYVLAEDDPINTVLGMHFSTKITESEQFIRNIDDGLEWLQTSDDALDHVGELLRRVRTQAIYGANDSLVQEDRDAIAIEVDQILNGLLDTANTEFKGDYIFSGAETRLPPFAGITGEESGESPNVASSDYMNPDMPDRYNLNMDSFTRIQYQGDSVSIGRQLQQSLDITINDTGNNIFSAETHEITSGSLLVSKQNLPLNDALNFNGSIDVPGPALPPAPGAAVESTSLTVGLEGGYMATVSYNADTDSIIDIAEKINEKAVGVTASVEKLVIDNVDYFKLKFTADDSAQEVVFHDSNKAESKSTNVDLSVGGFDPDTMGFADIGAITGFTPVGEVNINGKQFILSDYSTLRQFMNDVVNDPKAGVSEFEYDPASGLFTIESDEGIPLDIKEKGDVKDFFGVGNTGFFSGLGINTRGNLLNELQMYNKIEGSVSLNSKTALLNNIPGMEEGNIVINGGIVNIDPDSDTLESLSKKINQLDAGVSATIEEDVNPPGNFRLVLRSEHPGEMKIENRENDLFTKLGFIDLYTGDYTGYPEEINDPEEVGVFDVVMSIRDNLYRGDTEGLEENIAKLDEVYDRLLEYRSKIGARVLAAETSQSKLEDVKINTTNLLSKVEDVDIAEVIMKMQMQENVQTAALQVGASIIQTSLLNYLG